MHVESVAWEEVVARYRAFERLQSIWPTAQGMLRLASALRDDPRFGDVGRNVSHLWLVLWRPDRARTVMVGWSEPDGYGWVGEPGYCVWLVKAALEVERRIVVDPAAVVATILETLDAR